MDTKRLKIFTLLFVFIIVVIVVIAQVITYIQESRYIIVNFENITEVKIAELGSSHEDIKDNITSKITKSGKKVRVNKNKPIITAIYTSADGYSDGEESISPDSKEITIKPDYSEAKIKQIISSEKPKIIATLSGRYPELGLYELQTGNLYQGSQWYASKLVHKDMSGESIMNDDLIFIMSKNTDGDWALSCEPSILLTKNLCKDVPSAIINEANLL